MYKIGLIIRRIHIIARNYACKGIYHYLMSFDYEYANLHKNVCVKLLCAYSCKIKVKTAINKFYGIIIPGLQQCYARVNKHTSYYNCCI